MEAWYAASACDGPRQSAKIRSPLGHRFNEPIESLTVEAADTAAVPAILRLG